MLNKGQDLRDDAHRYRRLALMGTAVPTSNVMRRVTGAEEAEEDEGAPLY
jgi:hypothetical protein